MTNKLVLAMSLVAAIGVATLNPERPVVGLIWAGIVICACAKCYLAGKGDTSARKTPARHGAVYNRISSDENL